MLQRRRCFRDTASLFAWKFGRVILVWNEIGKAVLMESNVFRYSYLGRWEVGKGEGHTKGSLDSKTTKKMRTMALSPLSSQSRKHLYSEAVCRFCRSFSTPSIHLHLPWPHINHTKPSPANLPPSHFHLPPPDRMSNTEITPTPTLIGLGLFFLLWIVCSVSVILYQSVPSYSEWTDRFIMKYCPLGSLKSEPIGGDWVVVGWDMVDEWDIGEGQGSGSVRGGKDGGGEGGGGKGNEGERPRVRFAVWARWGLGYNSIG